MYQAEFVDNNRIWICCMDSMEMYDAVSGEKLLQQPEFDFGKIKHPYNSQREDIPAKVAVGIDVDADGNMIIVHRENCEGLTSVMLTVLDNAGKHITTFDTGMTMQPYGKFIANTISVEADGENARLRVNDRAESEVTVNYISA